MSLILKTKRIVRAIEKKKASGPFRDLNYEISSHREKNSSLELFW